MESLLLILTAPFVLAIEFIVFVLGSVFIPVYGFFSGREFSAEEVHEKINACTLWVTKGILILSAVALLILAAIGVVGLIWFGAKQII